MTTDEMEKEVRKLNSKLDLLCETLVEKDEEIERLLIIEKRWKEDTMTKSVDGMLLDVLAEKEKLEEKVKELEGEIERLKELSDEKLNRHDEVMMWIEEIKERLAQEYTVPAGLFAEPVIRWRVALEDIKDLIVELERVKGELSKERERVKELEGKLRYTHDRIENSEAWYEQALKTLKGQETRTGQAESRLARLVENYVDLINHIEIVDPDWDTDSYMKVLNEVKG
jgi:chromosome segregation ATPase